MTVTIYTIAQKAGVSHTAVSDILNCGREHKYPDETIAVVRRAAEGLGYRKNLAAKSLRSGTTGTIGVTTDARTLSANFSNPFIAAVCDGVGHTLARRNFRLSFHFNGPDDLNDFAGSGMLDGLVFIMFSPQVKNLQEGRLRDLLRALPIPVVLIHSLQEDVGFPAIGLDCRRGGTVAAEHMVEHGYETIGLVSMDKPFGHSLTQEKAYRSVLTKHGYTIDPAHIHRFTRFGTEEGYRLAGEILRKGAPARSYVVIQDTLAYGMMMRFKEEGIAVPDDIALIGYGAELNQKYCATNLTSVTQPVVQKGELAAEMLVDLIGRKRKPKPKLKILQPELCIRTSCGCNESWSP